jgi:hypothetical protein
MNTLSVVIAISLLACFTASTESFAQGRGGGTGQGAGGGFAPFGGGGGASGADVPSGPTGGVGNAAPGRAIGVITPAPGPVCPGVDRIQREALNECAARGGNLCACLLELQEKAGIR